MSLIAVPLAMSAAAPARAADTVSCTGSAFVFSVDTGGKLWRYGLHGPDRDLPGWSPREQIGQGWSGFGRVLAGPGGRIYGISAQGVQRYRHVNGAWETSRRITESWTAYATPAYRNKITVDESGDFYLVDAAGRLRWSRYNEQTSTWTAFNQVLATGWDRFDLIVAGTAGTLYAREPQGKLVRFRYDPASQRWLEQDRPVGTGWNRFSRGLMSAGGDTLFGITGAGDLHHYRFREDDGTWPLAGARIGSGWQSFPNVTTTTDTCRLTADHSPARPNLPATSGAPVAAVQAGSDFDNPGPLHFAYTNNGSLWTGSAFPGNPNAVQWTADPGGLIFTGKPTVLADANQTVQTFVQRTNSDLVLRGAGNAWTNLAGAMVATPAAVRLSDGSLAVFGVGADGSFWHRRQDVGTAAILPWTRLDGSGLTGELTAVPLHGGVVVLLAVGPSGNLMTARYRNGTLESPWVAMGSGAFVGAPAVVTLPGSVLRVFGRSAFGDVVVQSIDSVGQFPGKWERAGDGSLRGTGAPAAVLVDQTARIIVFSRVGDTLYYFEETESGSMTWRPARPASDEGAVRSDPVALTYQDGMNSGWSTPAFVARNPVGGVSLWSFTTGSAAKSGEKKAAGGAPFVERGLSGGR